MSSDSESSSSCTSPTPSSSCTSPTPSSASGKSSSSSSSTKRCNKPQMERKRRERINCSLNVLKQLVLDALKKDTSQYSKLEKADILEMTVKHLRDLQRGQLVKAASSDASVVSKYRAGFTECASEVTRYLGSVDGVRPEVRDRLVNHLNGCVHRVHTTPAQAHAEQQQQRSAQAYYATTTSGLPVYQTTTVAPPSASSSAAQISISPTRPIQIQIPVATSPASLPGAGVQALQMAIPTSAAVTGTGSGAASSSTAASAAAASNVSIAYLPRVIQHQQQQQQQQHTTGSSSPLSHGSATYMASFQVVASGAQPGGPAFMLPPGQLATPIYAVNASPAQQVQLQQLLAQQMAAATPTSGVSASGPGIHSPAASPPASAVTLLAPAPVPAAAAVAVAPSGVNLKRRAGADDTHRLSQRHHADSSGTNRAAKKMMMMTSYSPKVVTSYNANVAINETLRDEKVWRPW